MILHYGSYVHGQCEVSIQITREVWRDEAGRRRGYIETWVINGRLIASGADLVASLTTKIAALKAAYAQDGQNLILYQENGTTPTGHSLTSSACVGGVRVDGPSFPSGQGAEYATYRDYTIRAVANVEDTTNELLSYVESITVTGTGGSRFVHLQPMRGAPVKQTVAQRTVVKIMQSGSAVGRTAHPTPPAAVGSSVKEDEVQVTRKNPKRYPDGSYREYEISWSYNFESAGGGAAAVPGEWPSD